MIVRIVAIEQISLINPNGCRILGFYMAELSIMAYSTGPWVGIHKTNLVSDALSQQ
jgi:hypothetical protein